MNGGEEKGKGSRAPKNGEESKDRKKKNTPFYPQITGRKGGYGRPGLTGICKRGGCFWKR